PRRSGAQQYRRGQKEGGRCCRDRPQDGRARRLPDRSFAARRRRRRLLGCRPWWTPPRRTNRVCRFLPALLRREENGSRNTAVAPRRAALVGDHHRLVHPPLSEAAESDGRICSPPWNRPDRLFYCTLPRAATDTGSILPSAEINCTSSKRFVTTQA